MSDSRTRESAVARIRALLRKTEEGSGCTEPEMQAAATKAGELIEKYRVEQHELGEEAAQVFGSTCVPMGCGPRHPYQWAVDLAVAVGDLCMCPVFFRKQSRMIEFIGEEVSRDSAARLYTLLRDRCISLESKHWELSDKNKDWRNFSYSFRLGFAAGYSYVAAHEVKKRQTNVTVTSIVRADQEMAIEYLTKQDGKPPKEEGRKESGFEDHEVYIRGANEGSKQPISAEASIGSIDLPTEAEIQRYGS